MNLNTPTRMLRRSLCAASLLLLFATSVLADDRDLFRQKDEAPYVFVLLDTSGSMVNDVDFWDGTHEEYRSYFTNNALSQAASLPGDADHPNSRAYLAKSAIYEVVKGLKSSAKVGFATFPRPNLSMYSKHFLYQPQYDANGDGTASLLERPPWYGELPFPEMDKPVNFGSRGEQRGFESYYGTGFPSAFTQFEQPDAILVKGPGVQDPYERGNGNVYGPPYWTIPNGWALDRVDEDFRWRQYSPGAPTDQYRLNRASYYPKLGATGHEEDTVMSLSHNNREYRVIFKKLSSSQNLGDDQITVRVIVHRRDTTSWGDRYWRYRGYKDIQFVPAFDTDSSGFPLAGSSDAFVFGAYWPLGIRQQLNEDYYMPNYCNQSGGTTNVGWEDNGSGHNDVVSNNPNSYLYYPTRQDPLNRTSGGGTPSRPLDRGDMLPWDWVNHGGASPAAGFELSARDEFLRRMAPNVAVETGRTFDSLGIAPPTLTDAFSGSDVVPDFRVARYFQDQPDASGNLQLLPEYANTPPITFAQGTPVGAQFRDMNEWFSQWQPLASGANGDPGYTCRDKYVILVTDGIANCPANNDAFLTAQIAALRTKDVRTFVVGFGPNVQGGQLRQMANAGGTGEGQWYAASNPDINWDCQEFSYVDDNGVNQSTCPGPIMAANRDDLVRALDNLFTATASDPASFATAGVPTAQVEAGSSIFLASFQPVETSSVWPGRLAHFHPDIPLDGNGRPDLENPSSKCQGGAQENCLAWEAGQELLHQTPTQDDVDNGDYKIKWGGINNRRVIYSRTRQGNRVPMFWNGAQKPRLELFRPYEPNNLTAQRARGFLYHLDRPFSYLDPFPALDQTNELIKKTIVQKVHPNPLDETEDITFVLGDIFHSDPTLIGPPNQPLYAQYNLIPRTEPYGPGDEAPVSESCRDEDRNINDGALGYRCFFERNRLRRKFVMVGANDGMIHAFEAGHYYPKVVDGEEKGRFTSGTGRELFAYIPRIMLDSVFEAAKPGAKHEFRADGGMRKADVFMDPQHTGVPDQDDRMWRTVVVGGVREGGRGYFALDVTQPDKQKYSGDDLKTAIPLNNNHVPTCSRTTVDYQVGFGTCYGLPWPAAMWEFTDPDMGYSWSTPNTGLLTVTLPDGKFQDRFVAIFGGGLDPDDPSLGNHIYMVDIETGKLLYKRAVDGAVPSEPAAVDTNNDGYLDTVYIGTVNGFLYKIDISDAGEVDFTSNLVEDVRWTPYKIFDTGNRPLYYPPSVFFVASRGEYGLAFGTGDREDIFADTGQEGRAWFIRDSNFELGDSFLPFDESNLDGSLVDQKFEESSPNAVGYGWTLEENERLMSRPTTIAGVTVITTFKPNIGNGADPCAGSGLSRIFTVFTGSGAHVHNDDSSTSEPPCKSGGMCDPPGPEESPWLEDPVTSPYSEVGAGTPPEELLELMPEGCKFSNRTINLSTVRADTSINDILSVPICHSEINFYDNPTANR